MQKEVSLKLIRDNSNSQNSFLHLRKSPKADHVFISKQQRFSKTDNSQDNIPGPGTYIDPLVRSRLIQNEKQLYASKVFSNNYLDGFVSRKHQWIFGSDRLKYLNNGSGLGPGAYNIVTNDIQKSQSPGLWSKSSRFKGAEWSAPKDSIGPGAYNLQFASILKQKQMSIFKSKSPKTFIEQLQKDIQKNIEKKSSTNGSFEPFNYQQLQQLQKLAQNQSKEIKKRKMDSVFLSKSKRYELINPQTGQVGPGSYDVNSINRLILNKTKKVKSTSVSHNYIQKHENSKTRPGPTSYDVQKFNIEKQIQKKISSLKGNMALETRWKSNWKNSAEPIPGPGHYNRQRYIFINQKQYEYKPLVIYHEKIDVPFLSSASRVIKQPKLNPSPFGLYNLNQFDMSQKLRKKIYHIQKLRALDISVPGFQSSQRRTTFNLGKLLKGIDSNQKYDYQKAQPSKIQPPATRKED